MIKATNSSLTTKPIVNREKEIGLIRDRMESLSKNIPVSDPVLFFYGVPLVGKTTILHAAYNIAIAEGFIVLLIDFDRENPRNRKPVDDRYDNEIGITMLAKDIVANLFEITNVPINSPIEPGLDDRYIASEKLLTYLAHIQDKLDKPFLFLFDTVEDLQRETFLWLQEFILVPLIDQVRILIVIAGWSNHLHSEEIYIQWTLRRRLHLHLLRPFDIDETKKQLNTLDAQTTWKTHENLLDLTGGLPGLNEQILAASSQTDEALVSHMVEKVIFKRLARKDIKEVKEFLLLVSPLRQFDTLLFSHLLQNLLQNRFKEISQRQVIELLKKMRETSLLERHPDGYGYVISHDIRRVLNTYQHLRNQNLEFKVILLASKWFDEQLKNGDAVSIADKIYYVSIIWQFSKSDQFEVPKEFHVKSTRQESLVQILREGLPHPKNPRAFDLLGKIEYVFKKPEFLWVLKKSEIEALIKECKSFRESLS